MFHETFPEMVLTVLVDYFGHEITDALEVCARFPELAARGNLQMRLDTHGGRFLEGLDPAESYAVLERHAPGAIRRYLAENPSKFDPRDYLKPAREAAKKICLARFEAFGTAGNASKIKAIPLDKMAERYAKGELNQIVR